MTRRLVAVSLAAALALSVTGAAAARTFYAVVGPGMTIVFKNAAGKKVKRIPTGTHRVKVRDRSVFHNFHLMGPGGVNRKTSLAFVGKKTWRIHFTGGRYRYRCDAHPLEMHGSFRARR